MMRLCDVPFDWLQAAINTKDAPPWLLWVARIFGRRFTGYEGNPVGYEWGGKLYFWDYRSESE